MTFISLEGVDGSGKSTQARLLAEALGPETLLIREPGGTDAAERIRELLADPALEQGGTVVADRFADSSVAYQGGARGLGTSHVLSLVDQTIDGLWPDLTIYLRIDPEVGLGRADGEDRFEAEGLELQRAV